MQSITQRVDPYVTRMTLGLPSFAIKIKSDEHMFCPMGL